MEVPVRLPAPRPRLRVKRGGKFGVVALPNDRAVSRRAAEEELSQRLYGIILAVCAAENSPEGASDRLAVILEFIRTQSTASLDDLRRLAALG